MLHLVLKNWCHLSNLHCTADQYPALGAVHIANKIVQHRLVAQYETMKLSCEYGALELHENGHQFDFLTKAYDGQGDLVYKAFIAYLIRVSRV